MSVKKQKQIVVLLVIATIFVLSTAFLAVVNKQDKPANVGISEDNYTNNDIYFYGEELLIKKSFVDGQVSLETSKGKKENIQGLDYYNSIGFNFAKVDDGVYELKVDDNNVAYSGELISYGFTRKGKSKKVEVIGNGKQTTIAISQVKDKPTYDIVLDPGHGGIDPGASGVGSNEAIVMLEISNQVKEELEKLGYKVALSRTSNIGSSAGSCETPSIEGRSERISWIHEYQPVLAIAMHFDAGSNHNNSFVIGPINSNQGDAFGASYSNAMKATNLFDDAYYTTMSVDQGGSCGHSIPNTAKTDWYFSVREVGGYQTGAYQTSFNGEKLSDRPYAPMAFLAELFNGSIRDEAWLVANQEKVVNGVVNAINDYIISSGN